MFMISPTPSFAVFPWPEIRPPCPLYPSFWSPAWPKARPPASFFPFFLARGWLFFPPYGRFMFYARRCKIGYFSPPSPGSFTLFPLPRRSFPKSFLAFLCLIGRITKGEFLPARTQPFSLPPVLLDGAKHSFSRFLTFQVPMPPRVCPQTLFSTPLSSQLISNPCGRRQSGLSSLAVANRLNEDGHPSPSDVSLS